MGTGKIAGVSVKHSLTPRDEMKCPECGKKIRTGKSMLGGTLAAWHKPKRGAKALTFAKGQCIGSGNVYGGTWPK